MEIELGNVRVENGFGELGEWHWQCDLLSKARPPRKVAPRWSKDGQELISEFTHGALVA
jgi:hypothetical protein